jgi:hypothetical protein
VLKWPEAPERDRVKDWKAANPHKNAEYLRRSRAKKKAQRAQSE